MALHKEYFFRNQWLKNMNNLFVSAMNNSDFILLVRGKYSSVDHKFDCLHIKIIIKNNG